MLFCLLFLWVTTWPMVLPTPECGPSPDQDQDLVFQVPPGVRLYGVPGTDIRVPVEITNYQDEELSLMFSFQEAFPVYNLNSFTTHVELVRSVEPSLIVLPVNGSSQATVNLHISDYVPLLYRSKVTVIAKSFMTNITQTMVKRKVSFYFTVVGSGSSLAKYDTTPPTCTPAQMCKISDVCTDTSEDSCDLYSWVSSFQISDKGAGLAYPQAVWPTGVVVNKEGFVLGSTDQHTVEVTTSCCYPGVSLEVRDLAGNTVLCEMGEVMASADNAGLDLLILAITAAIFLIFGI